MKLGETAFLYLSTTTAPSNVARKSWRMEYTEDNVTLILTFGKRPEKKNSPKYWIEGLGYGSVGRAPPNIQKTLGPNLVPCNTEVGVEYL